MYSPAGNYEDIWLLPIAYIILLPGILSFIMAEGYQKISSVRYIAPLLFLIIYDGIYKIKLKKSKGIDESKFLKAYETFKRIKVVIFASIMCVALSITLSITYFYMADNTSKLMFLPFLMGGLFAAGMILAKVFKFHELQKIFKNFFLIIFLIFWFGMLIYWTINIIKQENNSLYILFSIPFWIVGILVVYKLFAKEK